MLVDYNEREKSLLKDIETRSQAPLNNALEEFRNAETTMKKIYKQAMQSKRPLTDYEIGIIEELKITQSNYTKLLEEYENERRVVELKAEALEAKYIVFVVLKYRFCGAEIC